MGIDSDYNNIYGYRSLENGDKKLTCEEFRRNGKKYIELLNDESYYIFQTWYYRLLLEHSTEEAFEILKKVVECDNKAYRNEIQECDNIVKLLFTK